MPVLPKHAIDVATFENSTLAKPIGSGPYVVADVDAGKSVTFKRDPNYWGRALPINRGLWNFDEVRFDFYRDGNAYFEAFKAGLYDVRSETDPGRWQTGYDFPAARDGRVVKDTFPTGLPKFASDFVFNSRRPIFADIRVRQAIALLFDFQWINRNFFYNLYQRSASYFDDSELSAYHRPADERERALLAPYPDAVRADVLDGTWSPPVTDGSGYDRATLRQALALFNAAGYELKGTVLRDTASGRPFAFEIMVTNRDDERLALAFANMLARAGIAMQVRLVDDAQYQERLSSFDFDMIEYRWEQSLSPGNEQNFYFGAAAADQPGSRNYMGVKSAAIDAMIAALLRARERPDFVAAVRALDRVLISGCYVVPLFYLPQQWVARRSYIRHPDRTSLYGYLPEAWWHQPSSLSQGPALAMILGDQATARETPQGGSRIEHRRIVSPRRAASSRRDRACRSAEPLALYRRRAAAAHLCRSRPHGFGNCRATASPGAADRCHRWHPAAEYLRKYSGHSRRHPRRIDRGPVAAVVAARRRRHGFGPRRRQSFDHLPARRQFRTRPVCHPRRRRSVFDPLCLRLWRENTARRHGAAR